MNLSGQQRKNLLAALNDAFRDKASLEQMLAFELDKNLDAIAGGNSLQDIVFNLIKIASAQGWVEDLVRAAIDSNPGNPQLKIIAEQLLPNHNAEAHKVSSPHIPSQQSVETQQILILAAIPQGLRLDKEIRDIVEAIRRAVKRDKWEIQVRTAVRPQDIRRALAEEQPSIVHFCGHGMEDGSLVLEDDSGFHKAVSPSALAALFKLHANHVKCVLLNACYSSAVLEELRAMVGGHPYLLRLAMYEIATLKITLKNLLQSATTEAGIYNNHLRSLLGVLQTFPELQTSFKRVVNSNVEVELDPILIYKLHSLGLVQKQNNYVTPRCQLYREYFRRVL